MLTEKSGFYFFLGGGGVHEKPIYRAELPKKREVDAPMHTIDT